MHPRDLVNRSIPLRPPGGHREPGTFCISARHEVGARPAAAARKGFGASGAAEAEAPV
jgi:hypothetical protein